MGLVVMEDAAPAKALLIHRLSPQEDLYQQQGELRMFRIRQQMFLAGIGKHASRQTRGR